MSTQSNNAVAAGFVATVNLNRVMPGTGFQATWTFKNTGTTTWNGNYQLAYTLTPHPETAKFSRAPLAGKSAYTLAELGVTGGIAPGQTVQLSLPMTAPLSAGTHGTNWQLQTAEGQRFGSVRWMRLVVPRLAGTPLAYQMVNFSNSVSNFNGMMPGQQFTVKWTLQNSGTAVWSGDFQVTYLNTAVEENQNRTLDRMGAPLVTTLRALTGREQVTPGQSVDIEMRLTAPTGAGGYAFHWQLRDAQGTPFGGVRWFIIGVGTQLPPEPPPAVPPSDKRVAFGMNVNINDGHPLDAERMNGLGWVRFVFWASRLDKTPAQAYQERYRQIIQTYADQGIRSLIILHQDTYWGNGPWANDGTGDWTAYAQQFGEQCGRVARACAEFGDMVAYQIHNEQDSEFGNDKGNPNHSAIGIAPANYALVLQKASAAIREAHPGSKVIFGGLKTGPENALEYVRQVDKALDGQLPVDALALHPYGRYVKLALFNYGSIGRLPDALNVFKKGYPKIPLWITEVGAAADSEIGSEHYANIATYIKEFVNEIATNYADYVETLIWFGWTDIMRNSGVNTRDNKPKEHVFDAFVAMRDRYKGLAKAVNLLEEVNEAEFVSFATTAANLNMVPAQTEFTCRWTFKNTGTTTWDENYRLAFVEKGSHPAVMAAKKEYPLSEVGGFTNNKLKPGDTAVFTLNLTAPDLDGRSYRTFWQIRDPQGKSFAHFYADVTVIPAPPGASARTPDMTFVADQTVTDFEQMVAGTSFDKQWRVRNSGARHWGAGFQLVYVEGDLAMARNNVSHPVPTAKPGEEVVLTVPMTAPQGKEGEVSSLWRLKDDRGNFFGDPLWVKIVVNTSQTPTAADTPLARLLADPTVWYSQIDPSWRNNQLGFGQHTIGTWGCLLTCMAMAISAYGTRMTPQELNQNLKNRSADQGGFDANSSVTKFLAPFYIAKLQYNKNVQSWPNKEVAWAVWTGENPLTRIDQALAQGHIVVAQVDMRLNTAVVDQHWVVIVQRVGDDYQIIDPLTPSDASNRITSLKAKYMRHVPADSVETNLRNAIVSTMVYTLASGSGN